MAKEAGSSEASVVASSSPAACWWETINTNSSIMPSSASWNAAAMINHGRWAHGQSKYSCDDDDDDDQDHISINSTNSFTNPSNHSTSAGSGDSESHLWNQLLLGSVGNSEGMQQISSEKKLMIRRRSRLMFDYPAACDYLKKVDGGWELSRSINNNAGLSTLEKQQQQQQLIRGGSYINYSDQGVEGDMACGDHSESRLIIKSNLTDLVSNWSINAPPKYPQQHHHHLHNSNNNNIGPMINPNSGAYSSDIFKHEEEEEGVPTRVSYSSPNYSLPPAFHSYGDHDDDVLVDAQLHQNENGAGFATSGLANQIGGHPVNRGLISEEEEEDTPCCRSWSINNNSAVLLPPPPRMNVSAAADLISFSPLLLMNKQPALIMDQLRAGSGGGGGKKKRSSSSSSSTDHHCNTSADNNTPPFKKPKHHHTSTTTSPDHIIKQSQQQATNKVKVGDKITALQQIVSPFGKTDTASVLLEAIKYIRFLQEQVQLLSDPYLKSNANKDHGSWPTSMERKEKADPKHDLRGRGLCLVPISSTPQAYRENSGPDYWTPPFRGYLYRS